MTVLPSGERIMLHMPPDIPVGPEEVAKRAREAAARVLTASFTQ
jgi:hypothetical protein